MSKISNSIIWIVFGIILLLFPIQASADSSLDGKISMDKPDGWEIVSDGSYYRIKDEGCADVLLEKTEQRSSFEKFIHREEMEYEDIVVVFGGFAMVLFVLIVIYLAVKVVRDILNEGAKKKARKVKVTSETQEFKADSPYERSLKDMLDSGLITKKEYRELKKNR